MRLKVPQFIDIEDKTIGPFSLKQFAYVVGGVVVLGILYFILNLAAFIIIGIPIAIFFLALALYRVNNRPLIYFLAAWFNYLIKPKLYIWKKKESRKSNLMK